ncbi:MAG: archaeal proteasome endopeptidase complex subunit beta [Candidatus Odinarchaeia archaeon]
MIDRLDKLKFKTGTTTLGLVFKNGVVLGSESRVSEGYYVASKTGQKVLKIDEHIGMTIAGAVADAQAMVDQARVLVKLYYLDRYRKISVKAAAKLISNILFEQRPFYMQAALIVGGIDDTGAHIYSLDAAGSLIEDKYTSTGSGSVMAYGVLEDSFKEDLTEEEAVEVAVRAIRAAIQRDIFSGNRINIAVITDKGFKYVKDSKIEEILKTISK